MPAASSGCGCFPIPTSTRRRRRSGTRTKYFNDPATTTTTWCGPIASACRAASAMSARARCIRRPIPRIRSGPISARPSARSTCGSIGCSSIARNPDNFMFQLVHTYRPGAMDTSLVSTDNINNPRTMNAVYSLGARLDAGAALGTETLAGGELNNKQFNDYRRQRTADAVLPEAEHGLDAARAEGRLRFGRRAGRAQPRLSEHRPVQRGMAAALQPGGRRQADHADRDRGRARRTPATGRRPRPARRTRRCSS